MTLAERITAEATFTLHAEIDDVPVAGNVSAHDPGTDAKAEKWVRDQLNAGNVWAWASVEVRAIWKNKTRVFHASDYLGGCSYESEESFREDGCYGEMQAVALAELIAKVEDHYASMAAPRMLDALERVLGALNHGTPTKEDGTPNTHHEHIDRIRAAIAAAKGENHADATD